MFLRRPPLMVTGFGAVMHWKDGREVADKVVIYFVEKEQDRSKFNPIHMNEYGVIVNWPRGFFDEAENTSAEILQAGLEKKRKQRGQ
ncbi:MAG: DUF3696 domain-containing protein [Chloroflexi bacterium]|nr:DUF3696 domain-containing protein [Chloroflexota bacterium]